MKLKTFHMKPNLTLSTAANTTKTKAVAKDKTVDELLAEGKSLAEVQRII